MAKAITDNRGRAELNQVTDAERQAKDEMAKDTSRVYHNIRGALVVGAVALLLFALHTATFDATGIIRGTMRSFSILFLVGASSFAFSALVGFLFGIPRTLQNAPESRVGQDVQSAGDSEPSPQTQPPNTNLEQVSDWLTKIIVGVGLTQLNTIPTWLWGIAGKLAGAASVSGSQTVILCGMVYFGVIGFLGGYLITRLFLANALVQADLARRKQRVAAAIAAVAEATKPLEDTILEKVKASSGKYRPTQKEIGDDEFFAAIESLIKEKRVKAVDRDELETGKAVIELTVEESHQNPLD